MKMFIFPLLISAWVLFLMKYGHTRRCWQRQRRWWVCGSSCKIYEVRKILQISLSYFFLFYLFLLLLCRPQIHELSWILLLNALLLSSISMRFLNFLSSTFFHFFLFCKIALLAISFSLSERGEKAWRDVEMTWLFFRSHTSWSTHRAKKQCTENEMKISQWGSDKSSGKNFEPSAHSVFYFFTTHFILLALE